jgi:hypothetical protein
MGFALVYTFYLQRVCSIVNVPAMKAAA